MDAEQKKKKKEYKKEWYQKNKEKIKEKHKEYRDNNKDKIKEQAKQHKQKNKDKIKEYNQTPNRKKSNRIRNWKCKGLISDDYDKIYSHYLNSTHCELCNFEYNPTNWRCMDHNHKTGLFRNVVCNSCNLSSNLKEMYKNNTSGHININLHKGSNRWRFIKNLNKLTYTKFFKTLDEAIEFKNIFCVIHNN